MVPKIEERYPITIPFVLTRPSLSKQGIKERIQFYADKYGVSAEVMEKVVSCESGYDPHALGDFSKSRGLVQIHSTYHPQITDEMAFDVDFSLDFLAKNLKAGNGNLWSCYRV